VKREKLLIDIVLLVMLLIGAAGVTKSLYNLGEIYKILKDNK